jgi:hypothetical protein
MTRPIALPAAVVLAVFVVAGLVARELAAVHAQSARLAAALDRIEARQSEQAERLSRLERQGAAPSTAAPAATSGEAQARTPSAHSTQAPLSPEDIQRRFEARFVAEPLAAAWAARQEASVQAFLDPRRLAAGKLEAPRGHAIDCRSRTCRIEMVFDDATAAAPTQESLVMAIGATLPMAQAFTRPRDDGRVEVVVYAGDRDALAR